LEIQQWELDKKARALGREKPIKPGLGVVSLVINHKPQRLIFSFYFFWISLDLKKQKQKSFNAKPNGWWLPTNKPK